MSQFSIILASGSPQRKTLLADAGYEFDVSPPHDSAECGICSNCGPAEFVADLSLRKLQDVVSRLPGVSTSTVVIACDTVAECQGMILGKPRDESHARAMLEQLSGQRHRVFSGLSLCLLKADATPPTVLTRIARTELLMDNLSPSAIEEYLATDLWQGKAGAFGWQDRPGWLRIVEGSESNVIGLPMELLGEMFGELTP